MTESNVFLTEQKITLEELKQFRLQQKAEKEAYINHLKKKNTVTTRKLHQCEKCNRIIPKGEQATTHTAIVNVSTNGWTPQFRTLYSHAKCFEAPSVAVTAEA